MKRKFLPYNVPANLVAVRVSYNHGTGPTQVELFPPTKTGLYNALRTVDMFRGAIVKNLYPGDPGPFVCLSEKKYYPGLNWEAV